MALTTLNKLLANQYLQRRDGIVATRHLSTGIKIEKLGSDYKPAAYLPPSFSGPMEDDVVTAMIDAGCDGLTDPRDLCHVGPCDCGKETGTGRRVMCDCEDPDGAPQGC